jgi:hypothetical protein
LGHAVHLGHPPAIRALAKHEAKTDRCDGDRPGKFQLRGILPESYLAPPEVRQRRERTRYRMALAALRTGVKNRIQAILHRLGILHTFSDLFGKAGRRFLVDRRGRTAVGPQADEEGGAIHQPRKNHPLDPQKRSLKAHC